MRAYRLLNLKRTDKPGSDRQPAADRFLLMAAKKERSIGMHPHEAGIGLPKQGAQLP